jgi:hypothetical protein
LKSPKESMDIFSQKLIGILNEGKLSVISNSIKEEEELNVSVSSNKNSKIVPSKNLFYRYELCTSKVKSS